ncbi:MAG TPA: glycosyltransferase family 9 protein [Thermoanaerobaculia bacterium]|nr:glycosyltransferase family 9 protein [Thermoanaerobaculia bacterium]
MKDVLVLRLSALGDVIHTIPAVAGLRNAHPHARIRWVVEAPYRELVEIVAGVEAVPVRLKKRELSLQAMKGSDTAIDFQGLIKSAALAWLSGAKRRIGFDRHAIREKPALLFTNDKVHVDTTKHVIEQNLQLAGVAYTEGHWRAYPTEVAGFGGDIVLLPGAGKPNKLWPVERFRELAQRLGPRALVVWGPGERELAEAIGARMAPPTNLRELAWLLAHAQLVIGADTGPLHLAEALGTKVVGLYGPTDPRRNGPYRQLHHVVERYRTTKWMESISVEEVMTLVDKVSAE